MQKNQKTDEMKVFISNRDSTCDDCGEALGRHAWIILEEDKGALCLSCADLDHLVFLPSGDAALTRRSKKHSTLNAIVLKWSRSRKRYERQGLLIEENALEQAEQECMEDSEIRERRRVRAAEKREVMDQEYLQKFQEKIVERYPGCPSSRAGKIAGHACQKYSGRVGRSAAAKDLDEKAVELAVAAHLRHTETDYDELLSGGMERHAARRQIRDQVAKALEKWKEK